MYPRKGKAAYSRQTVSDRCSPHPRHQRRIFYKSLCVGFPERLLDRQEHSLLWAHCVTFLKSYPRRLCYGRGENVWRRSIDSIDFTTKTRTTNVKCKYDENR